MLLAWMLAPQMTMQKNKTAHLIFPHQLFSEVYKINADEFHLIEDPLFFNDKQYPRRFHKQKLVLHRASMKAFADTLKKKNKAVHYHDFTKYPDPDIILSQLNKRKINTVSIFNVVDTILEKRIKLSAKQNNISIQWVITPNFLLTPKELSSYFDSKKTYSLTPFYIHQRKRMGILLDGNKKPLGGKWTFDKENRKKLPKEIELPKPKVFKKNLFVDEAIKYVNKYFSTNPGEIDSFNYPINHRQAKNLLAHFIDKQLLLFGPYQDAISIKDSQLFHSKLSAPLNIGLLSPQEIVDAVLKKTTKKNIASVEGFTRQIVGWREFMRAIYIREGSKIRNKNTLNHRVKLDESWYTGTTGIEPIDHIIKEVLKTAYAHHIERLMILGNMMLLLNVHPKDVYGWFMDLFIDAYDWVMVPNVYSMSQFADGGLITTKPYFSSSNYVKKMSDYPKGDWEILWDALFYRFLKDHRKLIESNPRLGVLIKNLDKLDKQKKYKFTQALKSYSS